MRKFWTSYVELRLINAHRNCSWSTWVRKAMVSHPSRSTTHRNCQMLPMDWNSGMCRQPCATKPSLTQWPIAHQSHVVVRIAKPRVRPLLLCQLMRNHTKLLVCGCLFLPWEWVSSCYRWSSSQSLLPAICGNGIRTHTNPGPSMEMSTKEVCPTPMEACKGLKHQQSSQDCVSGWGIP